MKHLWNREETIIAFNVYCKIPFHKSNKAHPLIIEYAKILRRSPSSLNMKIGNFGRLDPTLKARGIIGLGHGSKLEEQIWNEFNDNPEKLVYESEKLIAKYSNKTLDKVLSIDIHSIPDGVDKEILVKQRINQSFFRSSVLSAYNFQCCISKIACTELLEACHIVNWRDDSTNRLNPSNGLCLNALFHKAYDKFLLAITPDYTIIISDEMLANMEKEERMRIYLQSINGKYISLPTKFYPDKDLLAIHYEQYRHIR